MTCVAAAYPLGNRPIRSIPNCAKGHEEDIVVTNEFFSSWVGKLVKLWQFLQFLAIFYAPWCIVGQKYPFLSALNFKDLASKWLP